MSATTTEGTGLGSVDNIIPKIYNHQIVNKINVVNVETPPNRIDGGELKSYNKALKILSLSEEDQQTILKAAEILKRLSQ